MRRSPWILFPVLAMAVTACGGASSPTPSPASGSTTASPASTTTASPGGSAGQSPSATAGPSLSAAASQLTGEVLTYRGNPGRTGLMPGPGPAGTPKVAWSFNAGGAITTSPVVRHGVVYAASGDGTVHALDLVTGTQLWSVRAGSAISATPLLVGPDLIVADETGTVHALKATDGSEHWTAQTFESITGAPASDGVRIVVGTQGSNAHALDASTGAEVWKASVGGPVTRSVTIADGIALFGVAGEVVTLAVADGAPGWRTKIAASGSVATPTVADGTVFDATGLDVDDPALRGMSTVDAKTGTAGWRYVSPTKAQLYSPSVDGGLAFVVGHDKKIVALDTKTGKTVWDEDRSFEIEAAAMVSGVLYVLGNDGPVEALDAKTGTSLWSVPINAGVPFSPAVVDGYVVFGTDAGMLYAIGAAA